MMSLWDSYVMIITNLEEGNERHTILTLKSQVVKTGHSLVSCSNAKILCFFSFKFHPWVHVMLLSAMWGKKTLLLEILAKLWHL